MVRITENTLQNTWTIEVDGTQVYYGPALADTRPVVAVAQMLGAEVKVFQK
jgi:hypothetical protein